MNGDELDELCEWAATEAMVQDVDELRAYSEEVDDMYELLAEEGIGMDAGYDLIHWGEFEEAEELEEFLDAMDLSDMRDVVGEFGETEFDSDEFADAVLGGDVSEMLWCDECGSEAREATGRASGGFLLCWRCLDGDDDGDEDEGGTYDLVPGDFVDGAETWDEVNEA